MSNKSRIAAYGISTILVVMGTVIAFVVNGIVGVVVATMLIGIGSIALISMLFLEVGLGEDQDLEREAERHRERQLRGIRLRGNRHPRRPK